MVYDKAIDGKVHVVWMQDAEPGTSLDVNNTDAYGSNNIRYQAFDGADFGIEPPCDFTEGPVGLFAAQLHQHQCNYIGMKFRVLINIRYWFIKFQIRQ